MRISDWSSDVCSSDLQGNGATVQAALEDAVLAFSGERVEVAGAGRTDTGVHAEGQVAHIDLAARRFDGRTVMNAMNAHLRPLPIAVLAAEVVDDDLPARFSATWRPYQCGRAAARGKG